MMNDTEYRYLKQAIRWGGRRAGGLVTMRIVFTPLAMLLALTACEEAATPNITVPTAPPAAPAPTEPASTIVTLTIVSDEAATPHRTGTATALNRIENTDEITRNRTIRYPTGFKTGVRHDTEEQLYQWWAFESHRITGAFTNTEILRMGGQSLDNGQSWYISSMEITPSFRINVRAILGTDGSTESTLIVTLFAGVTLDLFGNRPHTLLSEAEAIAKRHLTTNSIVLSFRL